MLVAIHVTQEITYDESRREYGFVLTESVGPIDGLHLGGWKEWEEEEERE